MTSVFGFDGQFSVVTLDFEIFQRRDAVDSAALKLKGELERLGALHFEYVFLRKGDCLKRNYGLI